MGEKTSIVIPFHNEAAVVNELLSEIRHIVPHAEIIAIDDGSYDETGDLLKNSSGITLIAFPENRGQSAATHAGLNKATREYIVILDGDGQHDPKDIPNLLLAIEYADFVCGYRKERESVVRIIASRIGNAVRRMILKDTIRDSGSIKIIRKEHVKHLPYFDGLHRYIPSILQNAGLTIKEIPTRHRARMAGKSHYSTLGRGLKGIGDLLKVKKMLKEKTLWTKP
jgi:dolichol-phosphate mannosyltransferase